MIFLAVFGLSFSVSATSLSHDPEPYRIGDRWDRRTVNSEDLSAMDPLLERMAQGTVSVASATGFYLGEYQGEHLIATNYHVCRSPSSCRMSAIYFQMLNKNFWIKDYIGGWPDIDLAILSISVDSPEDAALIRKGALRFDFKHSVYPGQKLVTLGYGSADNPTKRLTADEGSDCMTLSRADDYRRWPPDPGADPLKPRGTWSFAIGCDASPGDSGSPVVDQSSGKVVGLLWGRDVPGPSLTQTSANLHELVHHQGAEIWSGFGYAVPATVIHSYLSAWVKSHRENGSHRQLVESLLMNSPVD